MARAFFARISALAAAGLLVGIALAVSTGDASLIPTAQATHLTSCANTYVDQVVLYNPGSESDSNTQNAIGAPQFGTAQDGVSNVYLSMGRGGMVIVRMAQPVLNGAGPDVRIYEATRNDPWRLEKVTVYASQDGVNWTNIGMADNNDKCNCYTNDTDLDLGSLSDARYFKLVDHDLGQFHDFDLNAIEALHCVQASSSSLPASSVSSSSVSSSIASSSSLPASSSISSSSSSQTTGCIEVMKEAFTVNGQPMSPVPQFSFVLNGNQTMTTNSSGRATFTNVPVGQHTVVEMIPSGWNQLLVTPSNGIVHVSAGQACAVVLFKNQQLFAASSSSSVSSIPSSSSVSSSSSVGMGCIEVKKETYDTNGGRLPITAQFTFTLDGNRTAQNDSQGRAVYLNVPAGTHQVVETIPQGWLQTEVSPSNGIVNVSAGTSCATVTFKNRQSSISHGVDFSIIKSDGRTDAEQGDTLTYTIDVRNNRNETVNNITVTDVLPDEIEYLSSTENGQLSGRMVTWNNLTFGGQAVRRFTVTVRVRSNFDDCRTIENIARVDTQTARDTTRICEEEEEEDEDADISIEKDASTSEVFPGGIINYTITVENTGDTTLRDLTVTDRFPVGNLDILDDGDAEESGSSRLVWERSSLAPGQEWTIEYRAAANVSLMPGHLIRNTATVEVDDLEEEDDAQVAVIGTLPQTGASYLNDGGSSFLRPMRKGGNGSASSSLFFWLSLAGMGTGIGGMLGKRYFA